MIAPQNPGRYINTYVLRITILLTSVGILAFTEILERLDFMIYDKLSTFIPYSQDSDVVIIAIDDQSLGIIGRWPWPRDIHAAFINRMNLIDNQRLALDLLFSEPQSSNPHADQLLASAIASHGNIVLPLAPVSTAHTDSIHIVAPLPLFRNHAIMGHADVEIDSDGVVRRVFLKRRH